MKSFLRMETPSSNWKIHLILELAVNQFYIHVLNLISSTRKTKVKMKYSQKTMKFMQEKILN